MTTYRDARALIAAIIDGVSITAPATVGIATVYQFRPDGGQGAMDSPSVLITGYQMRYLRGVSRRERLYTIGIRLFSRGVEGSAAAIQDIIDALKEAISAAFDAHVTLSQSNSVYHIIEGPNWIDKETQGEGSTGMWEDGEILLTIKDSAAFTA